MEQIEVELTQLRELAPKYAKAKSEMEYLKEFRKSKKALLMNEAAMNGISAGNKQEVYAYAHKDYQSFLEGLRYAIEQESLLRHKIKTIELQIEVWRSKSATTRMERRAYNA